MGGCLRQCSIAVKRQHDHSKRKHLIGWLRRFGPLASWQEVWRSTGRHEELRVLPLDPQAAGSYSDFNFWYLKAPPPSDALPPAKPHPHQPNSIISKGPYRPFLWKPPQWCKKFHNEVFILLTNGTVSVDPLWSVSYLKQIGWDGLEIVSGGWPTDSAVWEGTSSVQERTDSNFTGSLLWAFLLYIKDPVLRQEQINLSPLHSVISRCEHVQLSTI